eukprot:gene9451-7393_t
MLRAAQHAVQAFQHRYDERWPKDKTTKPGKTGLWLDKSPPRHESPP